MKKLLMLAIVCVVADQVKSRGLWITKCVGIEDGRVALDQKIARGQAVKYRPFIMLGDDVIHGQILGLTDPPPQKAKVELSSDFGKTPT